MASQTFLQMRSSVVRVGPDAPSDVGLTFAQCPHCGFQLAEVRIPSVLSTYQSDISCPICGLHAGDAGTRPGESLSAEERASRLTRWLRDHGYDPDRVYRRWGFQAADFFA
jgi:uncharacterized protein with PIN domain